MKYEKVDLINVVIVVVILIGLTFVTGAVFTHYKNLSKREEWECYEYRDTGRYNCYCESFRECKTVSGGGWVGKYCETKPLMMPEDISGVKCSPENDYYFFCVPEKKCIKEHKVRVLENE